MRGGLPIKESVKVFAKPLSYLQLSSSSRPLPTLFLLLPSPSTLYVQIRMEYTTNTTIIILSITTLWSLNDDHRLNDHDHDSDHPHLNVAQMC